MRIHDLHCADRAAAQFGDVVALDVGLRGKFVLPDDAFERCVGVLVVGRRLDDVRLLVSRLQRRHVGERRGPQPDHAFSSFSAWPFMQ
jgi:hypothetical protein